MCAKLADIQGRREGGIPGTRGTVSLAKYGVLHYYTKSTKMEFYIFLYLSKVSHMKNGLFGFFLPSRPIWMIFPKKHRKNAE